MIAIERDVAMLGRMAGYLEARGSGRPVGPELDRDWREFHARCDAVIRSALAGRGIVGVEQDDCAQEIWLGLIEQGLAPLRPGRIEAWLAAVARNKAADVFRTRSRRPAAALEGDVAGGDAGEIDIDPAARARREVWPALAELERRVAPPCFLAFYLRWIEGLSNAEIADALGVAPGQVRLRQHRARRALDAILGVDPPAAVRCKIA